MTLRDWLEWIGVCLLVQSYIWLFYHYHCKPRFEQLEREIERLKVNGKEGICAPKATS